MINTELEEKYISLRRTAISLDFTHLNSTQLEAVMTTQGPLLLLAGAGSGKTTVLINRIANLIKYGCGSDTGFVPDNATEDDLSFLEAYIEKRTRNPESEAMDLPDEDEPARVRELCAVDPVPPWRIIAITFTNKAAGEMKQRLEKLLGAGSEDIWASTFHSACARILRRDIDRLGYNRSFTIYDSSDTASLMKRILKDLDIEEQVMPHKMVLGYISRAKDSMISANDFVLSAEKANDIRRKRIGRAFVEYETRMKASNALDFDDLILQTVHLFRENPDVLQHYQKKFKYVLVDEYQDTNNLQYLLVASLAGGYGNICVVGDDDQSIYKFRGATIENILSFEKHFADANVIRLEQNYRSTAYILDAANDVIRNNIGRKGKKLWTENEHGDKPELHITSDEREEAQFVADTVIQSASEGQNWSEHTILYRMNAQSNQLETAFKRNGIPYRIVGGTGFYERAEIKDMLAYLCVLHNPHDDTRLIRIINNPPRGIGNTTIGRLTDIAAKLSRPVYEIVQDSHKYDELKSAAARLRLFADLIDELRSLTDTVGLDELYDILLNRTGYIRMLEERASDENLARIENVREMKTNIISFMKESGGSLFDFLSETALFTDIDRDVDTADRVNMMTMHSAKGLEFDTVFIVGVEEGIFPGIRSIGEPDEIEEERRLCYVAMTRAMRRLYFVCAKNRMLFGKTSSAQPSRFLKEISSDNIEIIQPRYSQQSFSFDGFGGNRYQKDPAWKRAPSQPPVSGSEHSKPQTPDSTSPQALGAAQAPSAPKPQVPGFRLQASLASLSSPSSGPKIFNSEFKKGDTVDHKAFGRGVITGISQAGGDALIEIAFDKVGTKRMMLNTASRYMKKVETI